MEIDQEGHPKNGSQGQGPIEIRVVGHEDFYEEFELFD